MAITIKDVAKLAGVSPSTVSRVCNNNPAISRETRERVQKAMTELGYELPAVSDPQTTQAPRGIAIVLPPTDDDGAYENAFYLKAIRGISQICNQRQVASIVVTGGDQSEILSAIRTLHRGGSVDGFILLYSRREDPVVDYLAQQGLLYVVVGKPDQLAGQTVCIDNDNLLASREATDYLYDLGHRRIGYLGSRGRDIYASDRRSGYQLSLLLHELPVRSDYCLEMDGVRPDCVDALKALLLRQDRPTAFVISDDMLVLTLEQVCAQAGVRIPEDLSIIAFSNSLYTQLLSPRLTAVFTDPVQLGQEAANHILGHAENPNLLTTRIIVPHRIVERESCKRIEG